MTEHYKGQFEPAKRIYTLGELYFMFTDGGLFCSATVKHEATLAFYPVMLNIDPDHYKPDTFDLMIIRAYSK